VEVGRPSSVVEKFLVQYGCAVDAGGAAGVEEDCGARSRREERSLLKCTW